MTLPTPLSQQQMIGSSMTMKDAEYYTPYPGASRKSTSSDAGASEVGLVRDVQVKPALNDPEAGAYVPFDVLSTGASGSVDYDRAVKESRLARDNPTLLAQNVSRELDVSWHEPIAPRTPAPVLAAGLSVFGAEPPTSTSRNMTTDLRGEAVDRYEVGPPPEGAGVSACMGAPPDVREKLRTQNMPREMQRCVPDCASRDAINARHETSRWSNGFWPEVAAVASRDAERGGGANGGVDIDIGNNDYSWDEANTCCIV